MATAQTKPEYPAKMTNHRTGHERTAYSVADRVRYEFDGYTSGPKPKAAAKSDAPGGQPQDSAGTAGKSTTTPADKPATTK